MSLTIHQKLKRTAPCQYCFRSQDGNWSNDKPTERCFCERGQLLKLLDKRREERQAREQEIGMSMPPTGVYVPGPEPDDLEDARR